MFPHPKNQSNQYSGKEEHYYRNQRWDTEIKYNQNKEYQAYSDYI